MKPTFFDLFSGIGGFRLALERLGWECVGWCEIDHWCQQTYIANFPHAREEFFWPDATTLKTERMPDFDILTAGFPCQAFSIAGKRRGFEDARGTLVYEIFRILRDKRPKGFILENVKGLVMRPFRDREFKYILRVLRELGYATFWRVLNSKDYGVPQNRERVYIVGFKGVGFPAPPFPWPKPHPLKLRLADILEKDVPEKYYLSERLVRSLWEHLMRHRAKGHGFGIRLLDPEGEASSLVVGGQGREKNLIPLTSRHFQKTVYDPQGISPTVREGHGDVVRVCEVANTISSRYYKDGSENLIMVGRVEGADRSSNRVYSPEGASPALTTPSGGRHTPKILVLDMFNKRMRRDGTAGTLKGEGTSNTSLGTIIAYLSHDMAKGERSERWGEYIKECDTSPTLDAKGSWGLLEAEPFFDGRKGRSTLKAGRAPEVGFGGIRVRRLTPRECARLQGFPDSFVIPVSDTQAYRQFGNAVTVPVVEAIGRKVEEYMRRVGLI